MEEYFNNSLERQSEEMDQIRAAVKEAGLFCVLGYSERYCGTLYIAQVRCSLFLFIFLNLSNTFRLQSFIDENGNIVHHRRKVKPTHVERGYWGDGQGESLQTVAQSSFGKIGGQNCWEHTQTLLRYYEYAQDVDIHIASWPLLFDEPSRLQYHITTTMSSRLTQVMAMEGACFAVICSQVMSPENRERNRVEDWSYVKTPGGGFSMIFSPTGQPLVEAPDPGKEVILYADIDLGEKWRAKRNLDVVGHYARPDQLSLWVNQHAASPVHFARDIGQ